MGSPRPQACTLPYARQFPTRAGLRELWCEYAEAPVLDRYVFTADAYERHLPSPGLQRQIKILEMGVQSGGSTRTWRKYYGERLYYVGVDINPGCVRSARPDENTFIHIGSQTNSSFLLDVCARHGPFDVVIDDGGHTTPTILGPLKEIFPSSSCMKPKSLYAIEDMHVMNYPGHVKRPSALYNIVGEAFWSLHHGWGAAPANHLHETFKDLLASVHGYPTVAFFERRPPTTGGTGRQTRVNNHLTRGTDRLPDWDPIKAFEKHRATICEPGAGASDAGSSERIKVSGARQCIDLCVKHSSCTVAVVAARTNEAAAGCFLRKDLVLAQCRADDKFEVHFDRSRATSQ